MFTREHKLNKNGVSDLLYTKALPQLHLSPFGAEDKSCTENLIGTLLNLPMKKVVQCNS